MNDYEKLAVKHIFLQIGKRLLQGSPLLAIGIYTFWAFYYDDKIVQNWASMAAGIFFAVVVMAIAGFILLAAYKIYFLARDAWKRYWTETVNKVRKEYEDKLDRL